MFFAGCLWTCRSSSSRLGDSTRTMVSKLSKPTWASAVSGVSSPRSARHQASTKRWPASSSVSPTWTRTTFAIGLPLGCWLLSRALSPDGAHGLQEIRDQPFWAFEHVRALDLPDVLVVPLAPFIVEEDEALAGAAVEERVFE